MNPLEEAMIEIDIEDNIAPLPARFTERMMHDTWRFGLLLITGRVLVIEHILALHRDASGNLWVDVDMYNPNAYCRDDEGPQRECTFGPLVYTPTTSPSR